MSLVEFALLVPLVILVVVLIIDFGSTLHHIQVISAAARDGARAAAAYPRRATSPSKPPPQVSCSDSNLALGSVPCAGVTVATLPTNFTNAVTTFAKLATCAAINDSKLDGSKWDVRASFLPDSEASVDGVRFDLLRVTIDPAGDSSSCLICWERWVNALRPHAESTFMLEAACTH